jgi:hypothetical protein
VPDEHLSNRQKWRGHGNRHEDEREIFRCDRETFTIGSVDSV